LERLSMADNIELNVATLSKRLRKQASGFRRLAGEILDGDFRRNLLNLAMDYDAQAESLERKNAPGM
jgi:hypothetical protein